MAIPNSPAKDLGPLFGYETDGQQFRMNDIKITENTKTGEKIARTSVNGKTYEARHPYDGGRAAEALGQHLDQLNREGKLASGITY